MTVWIGEKTAEYVTGNKKINPNGVDVGISEIWKFDDSVCATINGNTREVDIPKIEIKPDNNDYYNLESGFYEVRIANQIEIPENAVGIMFPRSTLNRLATVHSTSAIWDSGYVGYGTQSVYIPIKMLKIHKNEFWFQFMLLSTSELVKTTYDGHWQNEGMK